MKLRVCSEVHLDINHICPVLGPCSGNMITQCSEMDVASSLYFRDSSNKQGPARSSSAGLLLLFCLKAKDMGSWSNGPAQDPGGTGSWAVGQLKWGNCKESERQLEGRLIRWRQKLSRDKTRTGNQRQKKGEVVLKAEVSSWKGPLIWERVESAFVVPVLETGDVWGLPGTSGLVIEPETNL